MSLPLKSLRQACAELLACAVCDLFPKTQLLSSKITDIGFSYDFVFLNSIDTQSLPLIEERMRFLISKSLDIEFIEMMKSNAADFFHHKKQPYLSETILNKDSQLVSLTKIGDFFDLCSLKSIENTSQIDCAFKLQFFVDKQEAVDKKSHQTVTTIQGTAFYNSYDLKKFLKRYDQAIKRDHLLLGQEIGLFFTQDDYCEEAYFWTPKGENLKNTLINFIAELQESTQYQKVSSPIFSKIDFLSDKITKSYSEEDSYFSDYDFETYNLNFRQSLTPAHCVLYQQTERNQRELPLRLSEFSSFFTQSSSDELVGLLNSRFYQADCQAIFCTPEQFFEELISSLHFIDKFIKIFGFEAHWLLNQKVRGRVPYFDKWKQYASEFERALAECGIAYDNDESEPQPYGPLIRVKLKDALGREWNGPHIGLDLFHVNKLNLKYMGKDGKSYEPLLIVRSILGSLERIIALLIEHFSGSLPFWLTPTQVIIVPVSEKYFTYADEISHEVKGLGLRCRVDYRLDNLGEKVHIAEKEKAPYLIIVGEKEQKDKAISLRNEGVLRNLKLDSFLEILKEEKRESPIKDEI